MTSGLFTAILEFLCPSGKSQNSDKSNFFPHLTLKNYLTLSLIKKAVMPARQENC
jgi:hypothetical protein